MLPLPDIRILRPALSRLTAPIRASRATRAGLAAGMLALVFAAVTESSSEGHEHAVLEEALRRGADRLVSLQRADGTWAPAPGFEPDLRQGGRSGHALLLAWQVTRDPRHYIGARRAVRAIVPEVREGRAASSCNLLLLTEFGHASGQPALVETARAAWLRRFQSTRPADGSEAARQLLATPARGGMPEGDWRNYLLARAAEEADVARVLGHETWADAFLLEAASSWSPKHDHDFWASAAGAMLGALGRSQDPRARRLELAHRGLLEANEIIDGISWNDTPYDSYVYISETAAALAGRARHERGVLPASATFAGLEFLAARQAPHGGWADVLSLIHEVAQQGDGEMLPAHMADAETPFLNARAVEALALGLGARG